MKNCPNLSGKEWQDLAHYFACTVSQLPKTGNYEPFANGTKCDHDDLYRDIRKEGTGTRSQVLSLVETKKNEEAWPRGQYKAKFWLQARWEGAGDYARSLGAGSTCSASSDDANRAKVVQQARVWLLWEAWDEYIVDLWLQEHLEDFATYDHSEGLPTHPDYLNWLRDVRAGRYVKK